MSIAHDPDEIEAEIVQAHACQRCEHLARLAYYDQLTGLANRVTFRLRLNRALARARRQDSRFAVLFLDLDDFKSVNDTLGHDAGDVLLQKAGERLLRCVREYDTVARHGGDEFAILLEDLSNTPFSIAERITGEFCVPFQLDEKEVVVTISIGVAEYPRDADTGAGLLRQADVAMYVCKSVVHPNESRKLAKTGD